MFRLWFALLLLPLPLLAQFSYQVDQTIPVTENGQKLKMPWAGGLNSAQISTLDLDGDGVNDLVIFERTASKVITYLAENKQYVYHPEYESLFPPDISQWMLLRDFDCDGKKDLFTANNGIIVFRNVTPSGGQLTWEQVFFTNNGITTDVILSQGFSKTQILPGTADIPNIADIDGDGDLDIINMRFVPPGTAEFHKNMSMENSGQCHINDFVRITQRWGGFEECSCGTFSFNDQPCPSSGGGRTEHTGGKSLLTIDIDNDGDQDLLFTEETCTRTYLMLNNGSPNTAQFSGAVPFPTSNPVNYIIFPASYYEDLDFDGRKDFISSPNLAARSTINNTFTNSVWFYKNNGSETLPVFSFSQDDFLQHEMIDVGDYAYPAFVDYDGDGDDDMIIGNYAGTAFVGKMAYYQNTGSLSTPSFELVTDDFLSVSNFGHFNIKPQFVDMNGDGGLDLAFSSTDLQNFNTSIHYVPSKSATSVELGGQTVLSTQINLTFDENFLLADINLDGIVDLLLGKSDGSLQYWRNNGPAGSFNFTLEDADYMDLGPSITRAHVNATIADLDGDGRQDLMVADQKGVITIFGDFRGTSSAPQPVTDIMYNFLTESYGQSNLGGRIKPVAVNLFNSNQSAIAVGTVMGGILILKNDGGQDLPKVPEILLYPNPLPLGEALNIKSDRNVLMQIFSLVGQKLSDLVFITANQPYPLNIQGLSPGMYIATFLSNGEHYGKKFIIIN